MLISRQVLQLNVAICVALVVDAGTCSVQAAHERDIPLLLNKLEQSVLSAQQGVQSNNPSQIERGLGNAFVQGISAMVQIRAEQNQFQSLGEFLDISQGNWPFPNPAGAMERFQNTLQQARQTYRAGDLAGTTDHIYWLIAAVEYMYYQILQNGNVSPNGTTVAGVGGFLEFDGDIAYMAGVIDDRIRNRVRTLLNQPNVRTVVIVHVPGSNDDNSNTAAALGINQAGVQTHLPNGGSVESGGVDFFLAGTGRSVSQNFNIGVHSWAGGGTSGFQLRNNRNDRNHFAPFLNYYRQIGIPDSFYFFTIGFPPEDMHYMTLAEVNAHGVLKQSGTPPGTDMGIAGIWTEVRNDGRSKTITIGRNGSYSETGFDGSTFAGTIRLQGNQLTITGKDNATEALIANVGRDRISFPGQTFQWVRKDKPQPPTFQLAGLWTEVRKDGRRKQTRITGNQFQEFENGQQTFGGTVTLNGNRLTFQGNDGSRESFLIKPSNAGGRIDFVDPQTGARINRFHWIRQQ